MQPDLTQDDQLKSILAEIEPFERRPVWLNNLAEFLEFVSNADLETRKSLEFQKKLWEDNRVSGVGMGTVDISAAIEASEFREWVAEKSVEAVPEEEEARMTFFKEFHNGLVVQMKKYSKRTARVKMFRVLAAFYPRYFSTITDRLMALQCHRAWFGRRKKPHEITRQLDLMARLEAVLGPAENTPRALAERMMLPWLVYQNYVQSNSTEEVETATEQGDVTLSPLPALQRRKGFTSIRGGLSTIISALSFVVDGVSREELMDFLRSEFPDYRDSSLRTLINILKNEFYVIQEKDGIFTQTARGELYLESQDPQELIPLFITRTLGVDHVLCALKGGARKPHELIELLQKVNPGWTTSYAPGSMLKWLRDFELLELGGDTSYHLTESGKDWTQQIHWEPEFLNPPLPEESRETPGEGTDNLSVGGINQVQLAISVIKETAFSERLVKQLHLGLWSHPRRHFAILAGLSGSGKTLLAQRYGAALAEQFDLDPERHVFVQSVQPGWYDSSPLFGYINPLIPESYVRSPLLDFLLKAANHPHQPFVVILDEMNLSHPEQYFAPVLSAMESGDHLRFHNEGETFDGVPQLIPYPGNVAFVGTVNMDETTHGISDKVLDRAYTLEFWDINLSDYPGWDQFGLEPAQLSAVRLCLSELLAALAPERLHFGWRSVEDVLRYLQLAKDAPDFDLTQALDDVIYARILPKMRGSESQRLSEAVNRTLTVLSAHNLQRCRSKVQSLKADLSDTGMMRFWR